MRSGIGLAALAAAILPAQALADAALGAPEVAAPLSCTPGNPEAKAAPAGPPQLVDGLGTAGVRADTSNEEARRWFDQGVRFVWAFDEAEAVRSFQKAQEIDPACAMCAWGEAWARGPTINLQPRTEELAAARAASDRAWTLGKALPAKERAMLKAMRTRTSGKAFRNGAWAKATAKLAREHGDDDALLVIAADARMVADERGQAKPGGDAQRLLETVLRRNPDHSGAIHMYIHLTEWVRQQKLAEPYADRLGKIAPAASHLVHMPSHTYYGIGRYADATAVNIAALAADNAYASKVNPPPTEYRTALYAHNSHFAIGSALIRGDGDTALQISDHYRERYPEATEAPYLRVTRASTWYAYGRHADVAKVLAMPEPPAKEALMRAMRHYARGEALARTGDAAAVAAEAAAISKLLEGPEGRALGSKPVESLVAVARHVLEGRAAMLRNDPAAAATAYRAAMTKQEAAGFGFDPPPFWYPARRSLAAALIASGEHQSARGQLLASLEKWPNDPLAYYALSQAEQGLGMKAEAAASLAKAKAIWAGELAVPLARI
jgi:hypothetical protein